MPDPLVSAIIPNYNYARYIGEAVESVLAQTYSPIEIIVVDDGSTDTSIGILEKYADQITVLSQSNSGVSPTSTKKASCSNNISMDLKVKWRTNF